MSVSRTIFPVKDSKLLKGTSCSQLTVVQKPKTDCIMSFCLSCPFCRYRRATTKERYKFRSFAERNKACQRCILCRSLPFCPNCSKCPQCCKQSQCGRSFTKFWANLGEDGYTSKGGLDFERRLHTTFQSETTFHKATSRPELLCKPCQEPALEASIASSDAKVGCLKKWLSGHP